MGLGGDARAPGAPEEVAAVDAFLAGVGASYMTGQTIYLDGGRLGFNSPYRTAGGRVILLRRSNTNKEQT